MMANESELRPPQQVREDLLAIWTVMQQCVNRGLVHGGVLPGGLRVRAAAPRPGVTNSRPIPTLEDSLEAMDWVALYALSVNEENAAGGRVVTAPQRRCRDRCSAVLHYCRDFVPDLMTTRWSGSC